ncbi:rho-related GTP-binding protein RhoF isoform X1 [Oncorhynchus mykiss]|uniref:Ras homolog family member F, filopodia associated n=1 Tax=Oncorhynchus mykiss TaxID=8022 RepID=C1BH55_ONCMY|nr:rho-related GTP-binding protein RhoF isoform X1 [Oncorhynchus mykiss]ACO08358.1 Rho-related GTP-binding protein RhoF [Oncorhynchus mykiss]
MTQNGTMISNGNAKKGEELKIVIVGDGGCGKTSLLMVYAKGDFPEKYAPSVFEKYVTTVTYGGKEIRLNLYDTAGQDDYDRLRPLSYQNANLVLVCYDVTNPTSFENVLIKWYPEVNHFCRDVPVILIGCKTDLRKDKERTRRLKAMDQAPITYTQGEETRRHMSAELYLECSAKYRENVEDIFRDATKKALASSRRARQRTKKRHCVIL